MREKIKGQVKIGGKEEKQIKASIRHIQSFKQEIEKNLSKAISQIMAIILGGAITLEASDIHIEAEEERAKLRLRTDGILHDVIFFAPTIYKALLSRIKLLSGIKLNVTSRAQDGRFTILLNKSAIETRVSVLPSEYGETIVIRILNPKSLIEIENLGIREDMAGVFKKEIAQPNGMIIITGPTGSGKTTTLYAILKRIRNPEVKIITIEDPIEYHLKGISQSQVNPKKGYDFATGLRAIVRQDPDVILVGEIRDFETAKISLQAALTGHLVLTTLHTNDAAGTVVRLQALGESPVNIAPAINLAVGQRLIRRVCKKCFKLEKPTPEELLKLKEGVRAFPKKAKIKFPSLEKNLKIPKAKGCSACGSTGYKGRVGIFEFFLVDDKMEQFISRAPSISALRKKARERGMLTMREDGLLKVLSGITTLEEVERVAGK